MQRCHYHRAKQIAFWNTCDVRVPPNGGGDLGKVGPSWKSLATHWELLLRPPRLENPRLPSLFRHQTSTGFACQNMHDFTAMWGRSMRFEDKSFVPVLNQTCGYDGTPFDRIKLFSNLIAFPHDMALPFASPQSFTHLLYPDR